MRESGSVKLSWVLGSGSPKARLNARPTLPAFAGLCGLARRRGLIVIGLASALEIGFALTGLKAQLGRLDGLETLRAARHLGGDVQLGFIGLGDIGTRSACEQVIDLRLEFELARLHPLVAHRLVLAGIGAQLGTVHGDGAQFDQPAFPGGLDDLHEQRSQLPQMQRAKVAQRAVCGKVACCKHPKRDAFMQLAGHLARGEHARGVTVDQYLDHHGRVKRLIARPPPS